MTANRMHPEDLRAQLASQAMNRMHLEDDCAVEKAVSVADALLAELERTAPKAEAERDRMEAIANEQTETITQQAKRLGAIDAASSNLPEMPFKSPAHDAYPCHGSWEQTLTDYATLLRSTAAAAIHECDALQVRVGELEAELENIDAARQEMVMQRKDTQAEFEALPEFEG